MWLVLPGEAYNTLCVVCDGCRFLCVVCDGCVPHCDAHVPHLSALFCALSLVQSASTFVKPAHPRLRRSGAEVAAIIVQWPRGPWSPKGRVV